MLKSQKLSGESPKYSPTSEKILDPRQAYIDYNTVKNKLKKTGLSFDEK